MLNWMTENGSKRQSLVKELRAKNNNAEQKNSCFAFSSNKFKYTIQ